MDSRNNCQNRSLNIRIGRNNLQNRNIDIKINIEKHNLRGVLRIRQQKEIWMNNK